MKNQIENEKLRLIICESAKEWADKVLQYQSYERKNMKDVYIENGYDIQSAVNKFIEIVF